MWSMIHSSQYVERARSCTHVRRVMQPVIMVIKANSEAIGLESNDVKTAKE